MIKIKLRQLIESYSDGTGEKLTYSALAAATGISKSTLEAIGSRPDYNTTLSTINALCSFFDCSISDLLEFRLESDG